MSPHFLAPVSVLFKARGRTESGSPWGKSQRHGHGIGASNRISSKLLTDAPNCPPPLGSETAGAEYLELLSPLLSLVSGIEILKHYRHG